MEPLFKQIKSSVRLLFITGVTAIFIFLINSPSGIYNDALHEVELLQSINYRDLASDLYDNIQDLEYKNFLSWVHNVPDSTIKYYRPPLVYRIPHPNDKLDSYREFLKGHNECRFGFPNFLINKEKNENLERWWNNIIKQDNPQTWGDILNVDSENKISTSQRYSRVFYTTPKSDFFALYGLYDGANRISTNYEMPYSYIDYNDGYHVFVWLHNNKLEKLYETYLDYGQGIMIMHTRGRAQSFVMVMPKTFLIWDEIKQFTPKEAVHFLKHKIYSNNSEVKIFSFSFSLWTASHLFPVITLFLLLHIMAYVSYLLKEDVVISSDTLVLTWLPMFETFWGKVALLLFIFLLPIASAVLITIKAWDIVHREYYVTFGDFVTIIVVLFALLTYIKCIRLKAKLTNSQGTVR